MRFTIFGLRVTIEPVRIVGPYEVQIVDAKTGHLRLGARAGGDYWLFGTVTQGAYRFAANLKVPSHLRVIIRNTRTGEAMPI